MASIQLNDEQVKILLESLRSFLSSMSVEIAGTDRKAYRDEIKQERVLLREIVVQLEAASVEG